MTKYFGPMIAIAGVMITANVARAGSQCAEAIEDLKAMQKANQSISSSLISNHESFASVLGEYAMTLQTSAALGQAVTKDAVNNMNESAKAFRVRGQNAQKLNIKLNQASDQVIAKAIECMKSKN